MQLKTILNRVQKFKSFVYGSARWVNEAGQPAVEVELHARANSRAICPACARRRPGYDRLAPRRFEFIPLEGAYSVLSLRATASRLSLLWGQGGTDAVGQRQALANGELRLISSRPSTGSGTAWAKRLS